MKILGSILVQPDEVTEGHRELLRLVGLEGVVAQELFQACHDNREAQRVEPGVQELEIVRERCELAFLLCGDALELGDDRVSDGHHRSLTYRLEKSTRYGSG